MFNLESKDKKQKNSIIKSVNALKLDEKTIVIKGFNENVDNSLLNTIDLNSKNINYSTTTSFSTEEIIPITIDIALEEGVAELIGEDKDILEYEVASGDNLSYIADKFNISVETILWANDLNSKSNIQVGQKLVILPVSGISYKVKRGDTVSALAEKFNVTERDIIDFNQTDNNTLIIGETIIIPGGKLSLRSSTSNSGIKSNGSKSNNSSSNVTNVNVGQFARPIAGGTKTQGIHGYNGVDIGAPIGTSVFASLGGTVTLTRGGDAWNGGYGNYIVVKHSNGVQTLYAHLDSIAVNKGETVGKGQLIGRSGNTGRSTGPHLHFEVRGSKNPF